METLKSPQMADFKNIFTFIVQQLYPASIQMKIIKAEDEVWVYVSFVVN
jgi:hypothetical protein